MDVGGQCHAPATLPHGKRPSSHCIGGWLCPRGNLAPTEIQSPDCPCPSELLYQLPPPNVTPLVQPVDQGVIQNMKFYYQRNFAHKLVNYKGTVDDYKRTYTVRDPVFSVACAWNSVKTTTLLQTCRKLWTAVMMAEV